VLEEAECPVKKLLKYTIIFRVLNVLTRYEEALA
jgi:hypothetical protein